ncbi:MAG: hypothetical protein IRZ26_05570 [Clostridia bacterium]|nr:hypothetical protein [Clostridia bacterium]MCL6520951.1 hypothetical protein [Bacillota bacterium]
MTPASPLLDRLEAGLGLASLRQRLLAQDAANAETPGYRPLDAVAVADRSAPGGFRAMLVASAATMRADGSGVDPDQTVVALTENALWYQAMAGQAAAELARFRTAVSEGRQ